MLFYDLFRHDPDLINIAEGASLFREGDPGEHFYVLVAGVATISISGTHMEELVAGDIVGEMAVIEPSPRSATVTANSECTFAVIDQKRFHFLVEETPNFAIEVMRVMARRLRQCDQYLREHAAQACR